MYATLRVAFCIFEGLYSPDLILLSSTLALHSGQTLEWQSISLWPESTRILRAGPGFPIYARIKCCPGLRLRSCNAIKPRPASIMAHAFASGTVGTPVCISGTVPK